MVPIENIAISTLKSLSRSANVRSGRFWGRSTGTWLRLAGSSLWIRQVWTGSPIDEPGTERDRIDASIGCQNDFGRKTDNPPQKGCAVYGSAHNLKLTNRAVPAEQNAVPQRAARGGGVDGPITTLQRSPADEFAS
jgi:hypothetical protein